MGYTHFGKQAEVWKHLSLSEIIRTEAPQVYVETNAAYAIYMLSRTPEQMYGIYLFMDKAYTYPALIRSNYYQLEESVFGDGYYIGSPGLAMSTLGDAADRYIFFDLDEEALTNSIDFARKLSLSDRVECYNRDSVVGVTDMLGGFPSSSFIHIDPYEIDKPGANGQTYMDLFVQAAARGFACVLWYGFNTLDEKARLNDYIRSKTSPHQIKGLSCTELILRIIERDSLPCNPGIMGSGLLTANVSPESISAIDQYAGMLVEIYKGSMYREFDGELYSDKVLIW